jgi:hypothetical protein
MGRIGRLLGCTRKSFALVKASMLADADCLCLVEACCNILRVVFWCGTRHGIDDWKTSPCNRSECKAGRNMMSGLPGWSSNVTSDNDHYVNLPGFPP